MLVQNPLAVKTETLACDFLKKQGFLIVHRNWHCLFGEIDIIAQKKQLLLFVEVKYRAKSTFGGVQHCITLSKLSKIRRSIEIYLQQYPHHGMIRADAILFEKNQQPIHIENILES